MERRGTKTYWLLMITAILFALGCGLFIQDSYASRRSEAVWQTDLQTAPLTVTSDYLAEDGRTILLDPLTQERTVSFKLTTNQKTRTGNISYTVTPANAVTVQAPAAATATTGGTQVDIRLIPAAANNEKVTLSVCWSAETGEQLRGDFVMQLPAQEEEPQPEQLDASMKVMEAYAADSAVVVTLTHPADARQAVLSMAGEKFPAGTSYTTEYSQKETVLYDPAQISLPTDGRKQTVVLLKLPQSIQSQEITLQADVASENAAVCLQAKTWKNGDSLTLPNHYFYELNGDDSFTLPLSAGWGGCTLSYTVQKLTGKSGNITYETIADPGSCLAVTGGAEEMTVSLAGTTMQAGTYRLQLVWNYQTYTVADQQVTFHISYPERFTVATAGGNKP